MQAMGVLSMVLCHTSTNVHTENQRHPFNRVSGVLFGPIFRYFYVREGIYFTRHYATKIPRSSKYDNICIRAVGSGIMARIVRYPVHAASRRFPEAYSVDQQRKYELVSAFSGNPQKSRTPLELAWRIAAEGAMSANHTKPIYKYK